MTSTPQSSSVTRKAAFQKLHLSVQPRFSNASNRGNQMDVKGKVAIVTGASRGIGLATAKLLSSKGAKLVLVARSKDKLEQLAAELPDAIVVTADISKA